VNRSDGLGFSRQSPKLTSSMCAKSGNKNELVSRIEQIEKEKGELKQDVEELKEEKDELINDCLYINYHINQQQWLTKQTQMS
jgi:uncharacterized protein (UPF0335 family)